MYFTEHLTNIARFFSSIPQDDMAAVLEDIMTPQEISELGERIELLKKLQSWQTQREIASEMGISVTTVSRGSRVIQFGKQVIKKYL